jgi:hypothetical protein
MMLQAHGCQNEGDLTIHYLSFFFCVTKAAKTYLFKKSNII